MFFASAARAVSILPVPVGAPAVMLTPLHHALAAIAQSPVAFSVTFLVGLVLGAIAFAFWKERNGVYATTRAAQLGLIVFGLVGAVLHSFPVQAKPDETLQSADLVTLGFVALIAVGLELPRIRKGKFGGVEVEMDEAQAAIRDALDNENEIGDEFRNWAQALSGLVAAITQGKAKGHEAEQLRHFVRDRLSEAKALVSNKTHRRVRLSVWVNGLSGLQFYHSNEITDPETKSKIFKFSEGMMGQAFAEQRVWNEADAQKQPAYVRIRKSKYNAILLVPITVGDAKIGMLSVDMKGQQRFSDQAESVARTVSYMIGLAFYEVWRLQRNAVP